MPPASGEPAKRSASTGSTHPPDQRFPRAIRLRKSADFRWVQSRGRRVRGQRLLALYMPGRADSSRFGLVVSRKVGNAVHRNRVKRWLREAIRRNRGGLSGCWDLAIIAHPSAANAGFLALQAEIQDIFARMVRSRS